MTKTVAVACAVFLAACGGKEGPPGPQGETGAKGDTGAAGAAGPGINQTVNYYCTDGLNASQDIYKYPDGSVMVSCEINWTTDGVTSGFAMWRSTQPQASTARCLVEGTGGYALFSWDGNLGGTLTITASTTTTKALTCTKY